MRRADVAVVGAGPAGMAAAIAASESGAHVIVLDEYRRMGGQFFKRAAPEFKLQPSQLSPEHAAGERLRSQVASKGIEVLSDTLVWGVFDDKVLMLYGEGKSSALQARAIVIATGAYDRPVAFPGWTLPGVMTAGGAQTIARTQWVKPGRRVVIAGAGPFAMPVAQQVVRSGAEIVAIVEATRPFEWLAHAGALWGQWPRFKEAFNYWRSLHGVPVLFGHKIVRATGRDSVEAVEIGAVDREWHSIEGSTRRLEADALALAYGFLPNIELADACGCKLRWDGFGAAWFVKCDAAMATSVSGVFAAGEITGIAGSAVAMAEGRLAGISAAEHVGTIDAHEAARKRRAPTDERTHLMRFADALNELFGPRPGLGEGMEDATTVCRCEEVTAGDIRSCVRAGCASVKGVKDWTRAGMGPCQGRVCRSLVAQVVSQETGMALESLQRPRVRPPFKPVPFDAIAQSEPAEASR